MLSSPVVVIRRIALADHARGSEDHQCERGQDEWKKEKSGVKHGEVAPFLGKTQRVVRQAKAIRRSDLTAIKE